MDYLGCLPNDLITLILSLLSTKEAARTSILSTRWRHLWKNNLMHLDLEDCNIQSAFEGFRNLRSISLSFCMVTDAAVDSIVTSCTLLGRIVLSDILVLGKIRVSASLSRLKHLEIATCADLQSVFIESPNLSTLLYYLLSPLQEHHLVAPCLKEATLHDDDWHLSSTLAMEMLDGSAIEKLEKLSLRIHVRREPHFDYLRPCVLNHVKELSLELVALGKDLRGVDALLRASASLKSLHLSLGSPYFSWRRQSPQSGGDWMHQNLEKIQIDLFDYEAGCDFFLLKYLVKVVVRLVEIKIEVIHRRSHSHEKRLESKKCIEDCIGNKLCKGARLIIILP